MCIAENGISNNDGCIITSRILTILLASTSWPEQNMVSNLENIKVYISLGLIYAKSFNINAF